MTQEEIESLGLRNLRDVDVIESSDGITLIGYNGSDVVRVPVNISSDEDIAAIKSQIASLQIALDNESKEREEYDKTLNDDIVTVAENIYKEIDTRNPNATGGSGITITANTSGSEYGGVTISADGTIMRVLDVTVTPEGTYGDSTTIPQIVVDENGQITKVSKVSMPVATSSQNGLMSSSDKAKLDRFDEALTSEDINNVLI